jgi:NADPH:quinone reductase-like Zn-dependent oxidoreductase
MRAVLVDANDQRRRLVLGEAPDPVATGAAAIVCVKAFSLNRGETRAALSDANPGSRMGWDIAGFIHQAAPDGSGPPVGTPVVAATTAGWAEFALVPANALAALPETVSFAEAATLPVAGLTARAALAKGGDLSAKKILITGATGGVGTFALQLARRAGAEVTAAIRDPAHERMVVRLGAHKVAIGQLQIAAGSIGPFDLILESVGEESLGAAMAMLSPRGTCVLLGASAGARTTFDASRFRVGGTSLYGLVMSYEFEVEPACVGLAELVNLVAVGELKPEIALQTPWQDIDAVAHGLMAREFKGKAVLHID